MLAAKNMISSLEKEENYTNHNDDCDFGVVLESYDNNTVHRHKFRYSDGKEEEFSFDN